MDDSKYLKLPNTDYTIIEHPNGENGAIEIGLVKDHRFVFYFWFKWWKETTRRLEDDKAKAPSLITIDWHRDLCAPYKVEKQDLMNLNLNSYKEVALFSWDKLNQLNDGHILAAAYLNLIDNIYMYYVNKMVLKMKILLTSGEMNIKLDVLIQKKLYLKNFYKMI